MMHENMYGEKRNEEEIRMRFNHWKKDSFEKEAKRVARKIIFGI